MLKAAELENGLAQHYGTTQYYRGELLPFKYTDGVHYLWNNADCYWLLIAIGSYQRTEPFQVWTLKKTGEGNAAILTMKEDSDEPNKVAQKIPYTNFPLDEIELYLIDGVLILPSEY